jgi:hypothetical protein
LKVAQHFSAGDRYGKEQTMRRILSLAIVACGAVSAFAQAGKSAPPVVVTPAETDAILANPGMGWQTFHRTSRADKSLPAWIPSTVHYARWGWGELEPRPGQLDVAFLDKVLQETREAGQQLAFRVMCCSTSLGHPYHPRWLAEAGGRILKCEYDRSGPFPIPDMDDAVVLERHLDFIRRLGARYDGHPDIDHVDLGSIGWWGEWHLSGSKSCRLPTIENRRKVVEAYLAAFRRTPLVMLIGGGDCLKQATARGAGWRADCLGDLGGFSKNWSHMRKGYLIWVREAGIQDVWQKAPVAWESCWDMRKWVAEGWSLRYIFNYALALHGSYLNNKSAPLPQGDNVRPELERFLRRLGYRLVLKELRHAPQAAPGGQLQLAMKWQNTGSAPCYRPYRLAYRLSAAGGRSHVFAGNVAVNCWLPGSVDVFTEQFLKEPPDLPPGPVYDATDMIRLPAELPAGTYELAIAVVHPETKLPVVQLGIQARADDGWYPLSRVTVAAR